MRRTLPSLLLAALAAASAQADSTRTLPLTAAEELQSFKLPADFSIELVGSDADGIVKPIDLTFDDAGRLWTQTASMYPLDPASDVISWAQWRRLMDDPKEREKYPEFKRVLDLYQGRTRGADKILIIADPHASKPSRPTVWADGLAIPQSIFPYKSGAYVAQGSEIFLLDDTDRDGRADERVPLLTGFGFFDTHTLPHALVRAPGDWLYFSHGALNKGEVTSLVSGDKMLVAYSKIARLSLSGAKMNVVSAGLNNIWGFQLRANGQWYGTEANDLGWSVTPLEPGSGFEGIGNERIRPYQPWLPPLHTFRVGGTGISGLAFAEDTAGSFPRQWRDVALLANPITSAINAVRIVRNADGTVTAQHLPDFLTSADNWFRPVNLEFGPDGCLYIADWYNKIISHNETPLDDPGRNKTLGRIWRVCHKDAAPRKIPNLYRAKSSRLVQHLQAPSLWEKRAAWHQISDRNAQELTPRLVALAGDGSQDAITRIHALWSLEGLRHYDDKLMQELLQAPDDDLRREAVRALASLPISAAVLARHLQGVVDDKNVMVRSQALRTLLDANQASADGIDMLLSFCRPDLPGNALGGPYERKFERYLARMALERYSAELSDYLQTARARQQPVAHLFWATQALPQPQRDAWFLQLWPEISKAPLDEAGFVSIAQMLGNPQVGAAVKPFFDDATNAAPVVQLALASYKSAQSSELARLLEPAVRQLIRGRDQARVKLGLDVAGKLQVPGLRDDVVGIIRSPGVDESTSALALAVLGQQPQENRAVFAEVLARPGISFDIKLRALNSLHKADPVLTRERLVKELSTLGPTQRQELVRSFAGSPAGARAMLDLLSQKVLSHADFVKRAADLVVNQLPDDELARSLSAAITERERERKQAGQLRLEQLAQLARRRGGNAAAGEALFSGICLACHVVGGKGAGFAPALDGSAHRDDATLLRSILDPDATFEPAYGLYSVGKNDGSIVDGLLQKSDASGVTLKFMGGGELFIDAAEIRYQRFVAGRSAMPGNLLDVLSDEQIEDLLAYIRTLQ